MYDTRNSSQPHATTIIEYADMMEAGGKQRNAEPDAIADRDAAWQSTGRLSYRRGRDWRGRDGRGRPRRPGGTVRRVSCAVRTTSDGGNSGAATGLSQAGQYE